MTLKTASQIITANDLLSGEVVYLTASGAWSRAHSSAALFDHADRAGKQLEEIAHTDISIVGPYLAAGKIGNNQAVAPVHFREVFRATGPSNRFIGKQAHV